MKNKNFLISMKHAADGLIYTVRSERNFRIDTAAALYVIWFGSACGLSRAEWALLAAVIGAVLFAETMNTAVERAVDTAAEGYSDSAKHAKDAAAGASLVSALAAVAAGLALFADVPRLAYAMETICGSAVRTAVFVLLTVFDVWFVFLFGKTKKDDRKGNL